VLLSSAAVLLLCALQLWSMCSCRVYEVLHDEQKLRKRSVSSAYYTGPVTSRLV